jgi:hypothetical protein
VDSTLKIANSGEDRMSVRTVQLRPLDWDDAKRHRFGAVREKEDELVPCKTARNQFGVSVVR